MRTQLHDRVVLVAAPMVAGRNGTKQPDWTAAATSGALRAEVRHQRSQDATGNALIESLEAYLRPGVDLTEDRSKVGGRALRVRWRGTDYDLDGGPVVHVARGRPHHQTVKLRAVTY